MRRIGTVLALETERLTPARERALGQWVDRFDSDMGALEMELEALLAAGRPADPPHALALALAPRWHQVLESLAVLERRVHEVEAR